MRLKVEFFGIVWFIFFIFNCYAQQDDFQVIKGSYLDQKPPGMTPVLFAPDIFKAEVHRGLVFSPDGKEVYWDLMEEGRNILYMRVENNQWTKPAEVPFKSSYGTGDATISPDGSKLFFTSQESIEGGRKEADENVILHPMKVT